MATTPFTTWTELYNHLLTCLRSRDFSKSSASLAGGEAVTWSSADDLLKAVEYARTMAALETGTVSFRTYARDGGRG